MVWVWYMPIILALGGRGKRIQEFKGIIVKPSVLRKQTSKQITMVSYCFLLQIQTPHNFPCPPRSHFINLENCNFYFSPNHSLTELHLSYNSALVCSLPVSLHWEKILTSLQIEFRFHSLIDLKSLRSVESIPLFSIRGEKASRLMRPWVQSNAWKNEKGGLESKGMLKGKERLEERGRGRELQRRGREGSFKDRKLNLKLNGILNQRVKSSSS